MINVLFSPSELKKLKAELRKQKQKYIQKDENVDALNNMCSVLNKLQHNKWLPLIFKSNT